MGHSHEMISDVALLAGFSIAFYGLVLGRRRPVVAGVALGTGVGVGFLSRGVIAPGMLGLVAVLLPVFLKGWRNRKFVVVLAVASGAALPLLSIWPIALYTRSQHCLMEWFYENNLGRFLGFASYLGANSRPWFYILTLPWFAWPALPLALWALWRERRRVRERPFVQLSVLASLVMLSVLGISAGARALYALPVLVPLSLLAAKGADAVPNAVAGPVGRFHDGFFALVAAAIWLVWLSMILGGRPPNLSIFADRMPMDYTLAFDALSFAVAVAVTLLWCIALRMRRHSPKPVWSWFLGMTLALSLVSLLLLPWIDAARSYRSTFESMRASIPPGETRIVSQGLGECRRAILEYVAGIVTTRPEVSPDVRADLLLVQREASAASDSPGLPWRKIWEGCRPGDSTEMYFLSRR